MTSFSGSNGVEELGLAQGVSRETRARLTIYCQLLLQWQKRINLIAPSTVDQVWQRHFADSLQVSDLLEDASHLIDIGSGGGFPGLVCAIIMAEVVTEQGDRRVDLIESNGKKCAFLNAVIRETGLRKTGLAITVHNARIEHALPTLPRSDIVSARALASLDDLLGLTRIHLEAGSIGLFAKGRDHRQELALARQHWSFECEIIESNLETDSAVLKISELKPK